jgi:hypothetical protein
LNRGCEVRENKGGEGREGRMVEEERERERLLRPVYTIAYNGHLTLDW